MDPVTTPMQPERLAKLRALTEAIDGWTDDESHVESTLASATEDDRFLLVERSTRDYRYWATVHPSVEAAGRYNVDQEYAGDWDIETVIDIDTDEEYDVEFEPHARKRVRA